MDWTRIIAVIGAILSVAPRLVELIRPLIDNLKAIDQPSPVHDAQISAAITSAEKLINGDDNAPPT